MLYVALIVVGLLAADEVRSRQRQQMSLLRGMLRSPSALIAGAVVFAAFTIVNLLVGASPWSLVGAALAGIVVAVLVSGRSVQRSRSQARR